MSIYSSWLDIDDDQHDPACDVYEPAGPATTPAPADLAMIHNGTWYRRGTRPCSCGHRAPIIYQGSHVNPADSDPRGGYIDIAAIPNFLHPDVRGTLNDTGPPVEFLRLSVGEDPITYGGSLPGYAAVVLDRSQVEQIRDCLTAWLDAEDRT